MNMKSMQINTGVRERYQNNEGTSLVLQTNGGLLHQTPLKSDASKNDSL